MQFELTDEQNALQEAARRFARDEIAPIAAKHDQSGEFPRKVIQMAWELGLSSAAIPTEYGGLGLSSLDNCVVTEEIAWACS
ncbi:MAG: acyl-CoA dehydrogenase family protein, partial [Deltaproteobacteria bacterium]|nr:acyl-CoA dehydrogenase family protein [Deltaproteobacteria bacterium]